MSHVLTKKPIYGPNHQELTRDRWHDSRCDLYTSHMLKGPMTAAETRRYTRSARNYRAAIASLKRRGHLRYAYSTHTVKWTAPNSIHEFYAYHWQTQGSKDVLAHVCRTPDYARHADQPGYWIEAARELRRRNHARVGYFCQMFRCGNYKPSDRHAEPTY